MNKLLLILCLVVTTFSFSQIDTTTIDTTDTNLVFNDDWYASLDEPVNFITYRRRCEETVQFRIYRGQEETYQVTITNHKNVVVFEGELKQVDEINVSGFYHGIYTIMAVDSYGNTITKELIIG